MPSCGKRRYKIAPRSDIISPRPRKPHITSIISVIKTHMVEENKSVLRKRFESFLWRAGMMVASLGVKFILENLGLLSISPQVVVFAGLVLGEVSKYIDTKLKLAKAAKAKLASQFAKALR